MALLESECHRIRYELGYNIMSSAAEPYIHTLETLDTILQQYVESSIATTSSTSVTAATSPTPATLTLASGTGFSAGALVWIDVDDRQERATVQSISGADIVVLLSKAHEGTYPVTVDGGEAVVRELLTKIRKLSDELGDSAIVAAGVEQADEIRFATQGQDDRATRLQRQRMFWRDELAGALGVPNQWHVITGKVTRLEAY